MSMEEELISRIITLTAAPSILKDMCAALQIEAPRFEWNCDKRAVIQAELDAIYAYLY